MVPKDRAVRSPVSSVTEYRSEVAPGWVVVLGVMARDGTEEPGSMQPVFGICEHVQNVDRFQIVGNVSLQDL